MIKRGMSVCIIVIFICGIYGCTQTSGNAHGAEAQDAGSVYIEEEEGTTEPFHSEFMEKVIDGGAVLRGRILLDISEEGEKAADSGMLPWEDMAVCAEKNGQELIDKLETGTLPNQECEQLEENWTANLYYDCYYIDMSETGCIGFLYDIYPDYDRMGVESASAVTFRYNIDIHTGEPVDTEMEVYPITREEYLTRRERIGEKFRVIRDGWFLTSTGTTDLVFTGRRSVMEDVGQWLWDDLQTGNLQNGETGQAFVGAEPSQLAQIDDVVRGKREEGWNLRKYDGYYLLDSVEGESVHSQYYCYLEKAGEGAQMVIVLDTWISGDGIENIKSSIFMTYQGREEEGMPISTGANYKMKDLSAFLTYDWTSDEVLMEHGIQPEDSGEGWYFIVADIDFDKKPEMLIYFKANHCGQNSLYIYEQQADHIFSDTDTIAVMEKDIVSFIDYKKISPYMRADLFTVYHGEANEYRYLSLDYSDFGGDIHGGFGTICLYETTLGEKMMPKELVRLEYSCPDNEIEMYFCGERVYEAGALRDKLADYMAGYTETRIIYEFVEKPFARDIVGFSETDKETELEELYESLRELTEEGRGI